MKKQLILLLLATPNIFHLDNKFSKKAKFVGSPFEITVVAKDSHSNQFIFLI